MTAQITDMVTSIAQKARAASYTLAVASTAAKNSALDALSELLIRDSDRILKANHKDLVGAKEAGLSMAQIDRLTLNPVRLAQLAQSVKDVALLPDPVGHILESWNQPNGLLFKKIRVPIGVIAVIFEARPNVTIDCAVLCLKSGNTAILRGGKEILNTNLVLADRITEAFTSVPGIPSDAVQLIPTSDRAALNALLKLNTLIHCVIPRGGESLIRFVTEHSTIPVIKHYNGVCFVYCDRMADLMMALAIVVNAKTQRPGVCNAAEQLLIHKDILEQFLPHLAAALVDKSVELRCDKTCAALLAKAGVKHVLAQPADFKAEFLDLTLAVRCVQSIEEAITIINRDSSGHTETIITSNELDARLFQARVDSAVVLWNASTRFNDGFEFGYGAEIGISTDRLHARGPVGLKELCSYKFIVDGQGQIRT
jgi:glutamate-5-semialdehyde dehydrogenase